MMSVCLLRRSMSSGEWGGRTPDEWVCPDEIAHLGITVLYRAVACWALCLGRPVSVTDVCHAFAIQERRASDVLHYITHNAQYVEAVSYPPSHGRRRMVRVLSVVSPLDSCRQKDPAGKVAKPLLVSRMKGNARECEATLELRRWFVSRRKGEKIPGSHGKKSV
ncbi:TPA: CaiF/GrlA family transcriptional regulator [Salmonella enterica]|nr:CaiF/GrlA family transcriptional regulator [Salmonella enterica]